MNPENTAQAISAILKNVDFADIANGLLDRMHLGRRRPAISVMSTVGLIGLGAVGAFAVVALVPAVREALTDDPVRKLRAGMDKVIGATEEAAHDAERAVKRKMHDVNENFITPPSRPNNGNKLDV